MALTLETLFEAYENTGEFKEESLDFATDIYNFFGLEEGGIGAQEFSEKYSMYMPTYDPTDEKFAYQDKYLAFRNAGETHNLSKAMAEELYSTEMENVSGALGKEVSKGREMSGQLGLRSGTLESALEETMETMGGKAKGAGRKFDLERREDLDAYNVSMVDATLDFEKSEQAIKQGFYDKVMASAAKLAAIGAFDEKCSEGGMTVMCEDGTCRARAEDCEGHVDVCGIKNGTATDVTQCTNNYESTDDQQSSQCADLCHASPGIGADGKTCIETCEGATSTTHPEDGWVNVEFDPSSWREENYDYIQMNEMCRDEDKNWICPGSPEDVEGSGCLGCWATDQGCNSYDAGVWSSCDPACCPG